MALQPGTRIGPYDITAQIGAGGMGEVYRARDAPLGRDVAIKVLPEAVAHDPDRLARFDREAKVLAALNHPNIAQIYGLEASAGVRAVVMELVEGPTLADRLAQGPIPVDEALPIARQIAEAFEAAHEQAIVHRDLKPANVKVRADGVVKVLDFGLAKAMEPPVTATSGVSQPPTITTPAMTRAGMILGTAAYMSPEQARGKPVDRRADIWAFGCVLYEMLSGRRAFPGEEIADVLAAVLRQDIDWTALPSGTPPRLRRLIERCLDRDVKQRLRDIGEARVEIGKIESGAPDVASGIARTPERGRGRERVAWALVAALILATAALSFPAARYLRGPAPGEPARFVIETPPMLNSNAAHSVTVSPDGRTVAYVAATEGGKTQLFVRPIDSLVAKPLPGTDGAQLLFWSPDSRYIAFTVGPQAASVLKKIEWAGGPPQEICAMGGSGTWNADDVIVFANKGLHRVSAAGGQPTRLTTPDASLEETGHVFPYFLPDRRHFLYVAVSVKPESRVLYVGALDSNQKTRVMASESKAVYVPPGFLVFHREGTLLAQRFDATRLARQGEPIRLAEDVLFGAAGAAAFAASQTGTLVYRSGTWTEPAQLAWFDREGRRLASVGQPGAFRTFALSPDEKMVVLQRFESGSSRGDLWTLEISTGILSPLTTDPADENEPVWSPDSRTVMFASSRNAGYAVFQRTLGSREDAAVFGSSQDRVWPDDWSRDGRFILINDRNVGILAMPMAGDRKPIRLLQSGPRSIVDESQFSPDSQWVAYASSESGTTQIYVAPFPGFTPIKQVSANGGNEPHWSRDGKELFYLTTDGQLMAVGVSAAGAELKTTPPTKLFETRVTTTTPWSQVYAPSADGGRFLVLNTVQDSRPTPITVVLNWTSTIK